MDINQKSWTLATPPQKKYLSRLMTYNLSRRLNSKLYEVVFEGYLDLYNPLSEQPDVVIYSIHQSLQSVVAIEICNSETLFEIRLMAKRLVENHVLKEFFVYNYSNEAWIRFDSNREIGSTYSNVFAMDLRDITFHKI